MAEETPAPAPAEAAPVIPEGLDPNDPDAIALCPPVKAIDAKTYFQTGKHEGQWSEYDDRGVPTKNMKKKKPTKKEKDVLETEYLDQTKAYQKYLNDVEKWEQSKLDAEKALKKSDRLRWAFRQIGEKQEPIEPDDMETIVRLMGWQALSPKEFKVVKKGVTAIANSNGRVELEALRVYVAEAMAIQLMEELLKCDELDAIEVEELYSSRTWRGKLEEDPPPSAAKKSKSSSPRSSKTSKDKAGSGSAASSAKKKAATSQSPVSARGTTKKKTATLK